MCGSNFYETDVIIKPKTVVSKIGRKSFGLLINKNSILYLLSITKDNFYNYVLIFFGLCADFFLKEFSILMFKNKVRTYFQRKEILSERYRHKDKDHLRQYCALCLTMG